MSSRLTYCKGAYYEPAQVKVCTETFCTICCKLSIPPHKMFTHNSKCIKICDASLESEPAKEAVQLDLCVNSAIKDMSMFK